MAGEWAKQLAEEGALGTPVGLNCEHWQWAVGPVGVTDRQVESMFLPTAGTTFVVLWAGNDVADYQAGKWSGLQSRRRNAVSKLQLEVRRRIGLAQWRPKLQKDARTCRKITKVHAMLCLEDGTIETIVDGVVEARKRCKRGDFILIGSAGGRYTMNELSFTTRYDRTRPEPAADPSLTKEGFQLYLPSVRIWAHALTNGDVSTSFPTGRFRSRWGGLVTVQPGDTIAMPYPAADEIYAIPKRIFAASYALQNRGHHVPSQNEALAHWQDAVQAKGRVCCRSDSYYFERLVSDHPSALLRLDDGHMAEVEDEQERGNGNENAVVEAGAPQSTSQGWQISLCMMDDGTTTAPRGGTWGAGAEVLFCGEVQADLPAERAPGA